MQTGRGLSLVARADPLEEGACLDSSINLSKSLPIARLITIVGEGDSLIRCRGGTFLQQNMWAGALSRP